MVCNFIWILEKAVSMVFFIMPNVYAFVSVFADNNLCPEEQRLNTGFYEQWLSILQNANKSHTF